MFTTLLPRGASPFEVHFRLGVDHAARSADHALFLLLLVLTLPLLVESGRFRSDVGARASARRLLGVVVALACGHAAALACAGLGWTLAPARALGAGVALVVVLRAVHTLVPWLRRADPVSVALIAFLHGLAASTDLSTLGSGSAPLVWARVAFHAGIGTFQLLAILLMVPWAALLASTRAAAGVRIASALGAGAVALASCLERGLAWRDPFASGRAFLAAHPATLVLGLGAVALVSYGVDAVRQKH